MNNTIVFNEVGLDIHKNKKALYILRAINHNLRIQILEYIHSKNRVTVTEIYSDLQLQQAVASQHLAVLRRAGFVQTKKESKFVYYMLSYNYLKHFSENINNFLAY